MEVSLLFTAALVLLKALVLSDELSVSKKRVSSSIAHLMIFFFFFLKASWVFTSQCIQSKVRNTIKKRLELLSLRENQYQSSTESEGRVGVLARGCFALQQINIVKSEKYNKTKMMAGT